MERAGLVDSFGRPHRQLRLSVTDRCNLRCVYCMGPAGVPWLDREKILSYEEMLAVVAAGVELGLRRIRLTGGEPLVRKNLVHLIRGIRATPGVEDLSLTTNGLLLAGHAVELRRAGLDRVNISLDSLDPATYSMVTGGGELGRVLAGIDAALAVGLRPVKINVVLMHGLNDRDVPGFLRLAGERSLHLRFIEYMPVGVRGLGHAAGFLPARFVLETAASLGMDLIPCASPPGNGPAETYALGGSEGTIGLIPAISKRFCATCDRLRLTADGHLKPCLYWQEELFVRPFIGRPADLRRLLRQAVRLKRRAHEMSGREEPAMGMRCMSRIGG